MRWNKGKDEYCQRCSCHKYITSKTLLGIISVGCLLFVLCFYFMEESTIAISQGVLLRTADHARNFLRWRGNTLFKQFSELASHHSINLRYSIVNSNRCSKPTNVPKVVITVASDPAHFEQRVAIRKTWGHFANRVDVVVAFFLGRLSSELKSQVQNESRLYSDIVLADSQDRKGYLLFMLHWVSSFCSKTSFMLKTEDDFFINVEKLLTYVENENNMMIGSVENRNQSWRIITFSKSEEKHSILNRSYLISGDIIKSLLMKVFLSPVVHLEDVYLTDVVVEELNIRRKHENLFLIAPKPMHVCNYISIIGVHPVIPTVQYEIWDVLSHNSRTCKTH